MIDITDVREIIDHVADKSLLANAVDKLLIIFYTIAIALLLV